MTSVGSQVEDVANLQSSYQEKHSTVEQRMKWAVGANPDGLGDIFDAYSSAYAGEMESMRVLLAVAKAVTRTAKTVLYHEGLRTNQTPESNTCDSSLVALVAECQNSAGLQQAQAANKVLSDQELFLFKMNPPKENGIAVDFVIDAAWIRGTGNQSPRSNFHSKVKGWCDLYTLNMKMKG